MYFGAPDVTAHDDGKNFVGQIFQEIANILLINTKSIPVEAAQSMPIVKRYHKALRHAYKIIMKKFPESEKSVALQMALKSINDSVGPDGFVPTLIFFGDLSCHGLPTDQRTPSTFKRAIALRKAIGSTSRRFASRQVLDSIACQNGPDAKDIHQILIGSKLLVH